MRVPWLLPPAIARPEPRTWTTTLRLGRSVMSSTQARPQGRLGGGEYTRRCLRNKAVPALSDERRGAIRRPWTNAAVVAWWVPPSQRNEGKLAAGSTADESGGFVRVIRAGVTYVSVPEKFAGR